jgi:hypothetical protein
LGECPLKCSHPLRQDSCQPSLNGRLLPGVALEAGGHVVALIPLAAALAHGDGVVNTLGWCLPALLGASAMDCVHAAVCSFSAQGMLGPEALAVLSPRMVVASLLCCATLLLLLSCVCLAVAFSHQHGTACTGAGAQGCSWHLVHLPIPRRGYPCAGVWLLVQLGTDPVRQPEHAQGDEQKWNGEDGSEHGSPIQQQEHAAASQDQAHHRPANEPPGAALHQIGADVVIVHLGRASAGNVAANVQIGIGHY